MEDEDWPLEQLQEQSQLYDVAFVRKPYRAYRPDWDHDHCAACLEKFAEDGDALHEGYATTEEFVRGAEYEWVCAPCFERFKSVMRWRDVTQSSGA